MRIGFDSLIKFILIAAMCLFSVSMLQAQASSSDASMISGNTRAVRAFDDGKELLDQDQLEKALAKFEQAINIDYNFMRAHFRYMDTMLSLGRETEMIEKYKARAEAPGKKAIDLYLYGRTFASTADKRWYYRKALELDPGYYWAQYGVGGTLLVEGNVDEAIIAFNKALDMKPNWMEPLKVLGTLYLQKGMLFQAREVFEKIVELDPEVKSAYLSMARVYSQMNMPDSAEKSLQKAAALDDTDPRPYYMLGVLYELNDRIEDAKQAYRTFLSIDPDNEMAQAVKVSLKKLEDKIQN